MALDGSLCNLHKSQNGTGMIVMAPVGVGKKIALSSKT